jgi:hypothetical protein
MMSPEEHEEELEELMSELPQAPEELEAELKIHMQEYEDLKDSWRKKDRLRAEYHLGHIAGMVKALVALGYKDWLDQIFAELQEESDEQWVQTEGGKLMTGADRWMGRKVYQWGRGRPPYPGAG